MVPVSFDDEKFIFASINHISLLLGFEMLVPNYSRSQIRDKLSQQTVSYDSKYSKVISQSNSKLTNREIEREKRFENHAKKLPNYSRSQIKTNYLSKQYHMTQNTAK